MNIKERINKLKEQNDNAINEMVNLLIKDKGKLKSYVEHNIKSESHLRIMLRSERRWVWVIVVLNILYHLLQGTILL